MHVTNVTIYVNATSNVMEQSNAYSTLIKRAVNLVKSVRFIDILFLASHNTFKLEKGVELAMRKITH